MNWQDDADCRGAALDQFFPTTDAAAGRVAERFCRYCPVRAACLAHAERFHEVGVWGGHYRKANQGQWRKALRDGGSGPVQGTPAAGVVVGGAPAGAGGGVDAPLRGVRGPAGGVVHERADRKAVQGRRVSSTESEGVDVSAYLDALVEAELEQQRAVGQASAIVRAELDDLDADLADPAVPGVRHARIVSFQRSVDVLRESLDVLDARRVARANRSELEEQAAS